MNRRDYLEEELRRFGDCGVTEEWEEDDIASELLCMMGDDALAVALDACGWKIVDKGDGVNKGDSRR